MHYSPQTRKLLLGERANYGLLTRCHKATGLSMGFLSDIWAGRRYNRRAMVWLSRNVRPRMRVDELFPSERRSIALPHTHVA